MIIIDGCQSDIKISSFNNLEEILTHILHLDDMQSRIITDVFFNNETFSEIYPHQAEDISSDVIESVEIRSVPVGEMGVDISREMYKVVQIMSSGSKQCARLFRQTEEANALELFQDLLDVTRDFMNMFNALREKFNLTDSKEFIDNSTKLSDLLTEMTEVLEDEDWVLLADLLEYEFLPACENWKKITQVLRDDIQNVTR